MIIAKSVVCKMVGFIGSTPQLDFFLQPLLYYQDVETPSKGLSPCIGFIVYKRRTDYQKKTILLKFNDLAGIDYKKETNDKASPHQKMRRRFMRKLIGERYYAGSKSRKLLMQTSC